MWGLDTLDPRTAIEAMNTMNGSVRNAVFAPAFFGTPFVAGFASWSLWRAGCRSAARWFAASGIVYALFGLLLTMLVNVPMNEQLALVEVPQSREQAQLIWEDYSAKWQIWNQIRTAASGVALALGAMGLTRLGPDSTRLVA